MANRFQMPPMPQFDLSKVKRPAATNQSTGTKTVNPDGTISVSGGAPVVSNDPLAMPTINPSAVGQKTVNPDGTITVSGGAPVQSATPVAAPALTQDLATLNPNTIGAKTVNPDGSITVSGGSPVVGTPPPDPMSLSPVSPVNDGRYGYQQEARPEYQYNDPGNMWSRVDQGVKAGYDQTLQGMLDGSAYDPFASAEQEALARAEANQRAATAGQLNRFGLGKQGTGLQAAQGTEQQLLSNRFDANARQGMARQEMRERGMGEARGLAQAEERFRQSGEYIKLGAAQFNEGQRQFDANMQRGYDQLNEGSRQFDTGQQNWERIFNEDRRRYEDTEAWRAFEQSLALGSDGDVAAAYKAATGKDLDPAAIEQYRGYQRTATEQGLEAGELALSSQKSAQASGDFANYLGTHLDLRDMPIEQAMQDQGFRNAAQSLWESVGGEGDVPAGFADFQRKAANDPRLTNAITATNDQIDQALAAGSIDQETAELLKGATTAGLLMGFKKNPETGKVEFDTEWWTDMMSAGAGGTTVNVGGPNDSTPPDPDAYSEFKSNVPEGESVPSMQDWQNAGSPSGWKGYTRGIAEFSVNDYSSWEKGLPYSYVADQKTWEALGKPSVDKYREWYDDNGGKNIVNYSEREPEILSQMGADGGKIPPAEKNTIKEVLNLAGKSPEELKSMGYTDAMVNQVYSSAQGITELNPNAYKDTGASDGVVQFGGSWSETQFKVSGGGDKVSATMVRAGQERRWNDLRSRLYSGEKPTEEDVRYIIEPMQELGSDLSGGDLTKLDENGNVMGAFSPEELKNIRDVLVKYDVLDDPARPSAPKYDSSAFKTIL